MRARRIAVAVAAFIAVSSGVGLMRDSVPAGAATGESTRNFQLVGHNALSGRGMNAAPALFGHYIYVGSRSDGTHLHSGVQIVDIARPSAPQVVGEIPLPTDLSVAYTSRELRVWPQQGVLMVLYFGCSALIHACVSGSDSGEQPLQRINFLDVAGAAGAAPKLISTYKPSTTPHEMYLWVDPKHAATRALLYWTSPNNSAQQLVVTDISGWRAGVFNEVTTFSAVARFSAADQTNFDIRLHSLSISADGTQGYLAYLGGGVLVIDTSDLALNRPDPRIRLVTPIAGRVYWDYEGAHSSVIVPGRPYIFTTEEIYGKGTPVMQKLFGPAFGGCPWGWVRVVDMRNPARLVKVSEYKLAENRQDCAGVSPAADNFSSYTSHNPTLLPDLALLTWHSAGLQAIDLANPARPTDAGHYVPAPDMLQPGHTIDPALEPGANGTIAWSYPIIYRGLIYYIDVINGLYVVRYTGPHAKEVAGITFLEGNSNLGDAYRLAHPGTH